MLRRLARRIIAKLSRSGFAGSRMSSSMLTISLTTSCFDHRKQITQGKLKPFKLSFNWEVARKIRSIRRELDAIKSDIDGLGLRDLSPREVSVLPINDLLKNRETYSFVQTNDVIGRDDDKNQLIQMLIAEPMPDEQNVTVIPIVGFGGLGKTALAQLVFNDERVKHHFDLTKWTCVPEVNRQVQVMGIVFRSFTGRDHNNLSTEQLQEGIRDSINNKRFFLVMDDIWDESRERWLPLLQLLQCGKRGSKIMITSRSGAIANALGTISTYKLGLLKQVDSWKLFKRLALRPGQEENNPNFTEIGKQIVEKCHNVPLAIRAIASLLYSRDTEQEWLLIKDTHLSKTTELSEESKIMHVLKLSYDFLPSPLKQCFAYCSLFPKDHLFDKGKLVYLWMAQGYIEPVNKQNADLDDLGDVYFLELLRRNFFQDIQQDHSSSVGIVRCKMHDLIHDLAQHVATDILDTGICMPLETYLNALWPPVTDGKKTLLLKYRSHLPLSFIEFIILGLPSLRALEPVSFNFKTLPISIKRLRHLRYLNLSFNGKLQILPEFIVTLINLLTLNLDWCSNLKELPGGITKLTNLRHLGIKGCPLSDMPSDFGSMKSLRKLNKFVVGKSNGLDALAQMNLMGYLEIEFRSWRGDAVLEASNLRDKLHLVGLELYYNKSESSMIEVFPPNLISLSIDGYVKERFPQRMVDGSSSSLHKLVEVRIMNCVNCKLLPCLSQLLHLKYLHLRGLKVLEYIEDEGSSASCTVYFPSLLELELWSMPILKEWSRLKHNLVLPRVSKLWIYECHQLKSIPVLPPMLEDARLDGIDEKLLRFLVPPLTEPDAHCSPACSKLKRLDITCMDSVVSWSIDVPSLERLIIQCCKQLTSLQVKSSNCSLRHLNISNCGALRDVSNALQQLPSLEYLDINGCEELLDQWDMTNRQAATISVNPRSLSIANYSKLEVLPSGIWSFFKALQCLRLACLHNLKALPEQIGHLTQLQNLNISHCRKLETLPPSIASLISLQGLDIQDCPLLKQKWKLLMKTTSKSNSK